MTTRLGYIFALGLVMGLALSVTGARAENRPGGEVQLFTLLNGVVSRDYNPSTFGAAAADGGGLTLYTVDAGPGCQAVRTGAVYEMHCGSGGAHFCPWFDGGVSCNSTVGSINYGKPVGASSPSAPAPFYFVAPGDAAAGTTTNVCIAPPSGSLSQTCALFRLK